jgi:hypothetical protein
MTLPRVRPASPKPVSHPSFGGRSAFNFLAKKPRRNLEFIFVLIEGCGVWGQRRIESHLSLQHLDVQLLMWDMRRNLNTTPMPKKRSVVQFSYPELPAMQRSWWLIVDPRESVDLYVSVDLRTMTAIWMGLDTVRAAIANRRLMLTGNRELATAMQGWLGLSPFAKEKKLAN